MAGADILFNRVPLVVNVELASVLGLNESIILQQIHYWLEKNRNDGRNFRDGFIWTYNTYKEWQEQFPFWSDSTIKRTISRLENMGLLVSAKYNKEKFDRTKWYRIDYEELNILVTSRCGQNDTIDNNGVSSDELAITQEEEPQNNHPMTQNTHKARNIALGQNDPIDNSNLTKSIMSNCPYPSAQIDLFNEGKLTPPIPETNNRDYPEITTTNKESDSCSCCEKNFSHISPEDIKQVLQVFRDSGIYISSNQVINQLAEVYTLNEIRIIAAVLADRKKRGLIKNPGGMLAANPLAIAGSILRGDFYPLQPQTCRSNNQSSAYSEYEIYVPPEKLKELNRKGGEG